MKKALQATLLLLCCFLVGSTALAEPGTIVLNNGNRLEGEVLQKTDQRIVLDLDFTVITVPADRVKRIDRRDDNGVRTTEDAAVRNNLWVERNDLERTSVSNAAKHVSESVVKVQTPIGQGSGFIINEDGYVITNNHVISGTRKITITVYRKRDKSLVKENRENVKIIATSPGFDLALLKIESTGAESDSFPAAPLGNSDELEEGETVFAIGSPMGFERTVTKGVVSLKNRLIREFPHIQTTTEINPGNSGGPLFNTEGEVVGVTNMKIRTMLGAEGLGFAIPVNVVKWFLTTRNAFAFDTENPNAGFRYHSPSMTPDPGSGDAENGEDTE